MPPRALLLLLLVAGCSKDNPLFLGADEGTASAGVTSDATSTGAPTTSTTSSTSSSTATDPGSTSLALTGSGGTSTTGEPGSSSTGEPLICPDSAPEMHLSFADPDAPNDDLAAVDCEAPPDDKKPFIAEALVPGGVRLRQCADDGCMLKTKTYDLLVEFPGSDLLFMKVPLQKPLGIHRWGAYQLGANICGLGGLAVYQESNYDSVPLLVARRAHALAEDLVPPALGKLSVAIQADPAAQDGCVSDLLCEPLQGTHATEFKLYLSKQDQAVALSLASPGDGVVQIVDPNDQPMLHVFHVRSHVAAEECFQRSEWALSKL